MVFLVLSTDPEAVARQSTEQIDVESDFQSLFKLL